MSNQQDPVAANAPSHDQAKPPDDQDRPSDDQDRPADAQGEPREISVVATRYKFEPARIEVTEGERVRLVVSSDDGVHGVEVKKLKINRKVPRDGKVMIDFVASEPGEFPILCSEYCGKGHDVMKGMLVVAAKSAR